MKIIHAMRSTQILEMGGGSITILPHAFSSYHPAESPKVSWQLSEHGVQVPPQYQERHTFTQGGQGVCDLKPSLSNDILIRNL